MPGRADNPDSTLDHPTSPINGLARRARLLAVTCAILLAAGSHGFAQSPAWEHQPYRISALIALDLPGGLAGQLSSSLPAYLDRRAYASVGPIWSFQAELADGPASRTIHRDLKEFSDKPPPNISLDGLDKLVLVSVRSSPDEHIITAREYDTLVERWGSPIRRVCRQDGAIEESVFQTITDTVCPVAQFEVDPNDEKFVMLKPRGAALMRQAAEGMSSRPGDVYLPVFRRTSRSGQLVENGIQVVPWTFLEVVPSDEKTASSRARILSGTRRPFGIRRQGRVEQVALALRSDPADVLLQLRSRVAKEKPLAGYEIFAQTDPDKLDSLARLGATDRAGNFEVSPGKRPVRLLFVKNGGHLLARLPVVPGAQKTVDIPLPDDDARLAAETRLSAMREDLIDVVARRNILMARVRQKIKDEEFDGAQKLLNDINDLPGRTQFNLELTTAARRLRSSDPQIQRRIDKLFEGTQAALTQYLDVGPVSELTNELRAAKQEKSTKGS